MSGVWGTEGKDTAEDNEGTENEERHAPKADFFNACTKTSVNHKKVEDDTGDEAEQGGRKTMGEKSAIGMEANKGGEVGRIGGGVGPKHHFTGEVFPSIAQAPRFDPKVVHVDDDGNDQAEDAEVGGKPVLP